MLRKVLRVLGLLIIIILIAIGILWIATVTKGLIDGPLLEP